MSKVALAEDTHAELSSMPKAGWEDEATKGNDVHQRDNWSDFAEDGDADCRGCDEGYNEEEQQQQRQQPLSSEALDLSQHVDAEPLNKVMQMEMDR